MAIYRTCPHCGDNLDPGEICECIEERNKKQQLKNDRDAQISILQESDCTQLRLQVCCYT